MVQMLFRVLTLIAALGLPASVLAYDPSWYRMDQWSGEYPSGFTMTETRTIELRERPDPEAPRTIPCRFEKNATYHPWNHQRIDKQHLQFVSFTKSQAYAVQTGFQDVLLKEGTDEEVAIAFNAGDHWRYLAYLAEGEVLLEYRGERYIADQTVFEHSVPLRSGAAALEQGYEEWMRLSCPDGAQGWFFMRELAEMSGAGPPHIIRYGTAADIAAPAR